MFGSTFNSLHFSDNFFLNGLFLFLLLLKYMGGGFGSK